MREEIENLITKFLAIGLFVTTVLVITGVVTDPVNTPKLFSVGVLGTATCGLYLFAHLHRFMKIKVFEILASLFLFWMVVTLFTSPAPLSQNLYGVYGRNTGFLAYTSLTFICLSASLFKNFRNFENLVKVFLATGFINLVYCTWCVAFGDFVGWNNPYGAILGTFGNPNFISAFFGILFSVLFALSFFIDRKYLIALSIVMLINIYLLIKSDSIQGILIGMSGCWLFGMFFILSKSKNRIYISGFFATGVIGSFVGVLGVAGRGPISKFIAQSTFAFREQYWYAALQMARNNPIFGVGMDSYGDWYRRSRGAKALISPGPDVVTNVAHSVPLDILAYGGLPLFIIYLMLILTVLISVFKVYRLGINFNFTYMSLVLIWFGYQLQSLISINQIGLAVWGWVSSGLLIGYSRMVVETENPIDLSPKNRKKIVNRYPQIFLIGVSGIIIGAVISFPPLNSDIMYASSLKSKNLQDLEKSLSNNYFTPLTSFRLAQSVQLLEQSNLPTIALKYARKGVKFNPNYDDAWEMLFFAPGATSDEKKLAKINLIRLDPLNPKWKRLQ